MIETKITCDECGKECTTKSSYPAKWTLELKAIDTNTNNTGAVFGCMVYSPIESTLHFCGKLCIANFIIKQNGLASIIN